MYLEDTKAILASIELAPNDQQFLIRIFHIISKKNDLHLQANYATKGYVELSYWADIAQIQESYTMRNILRSRSLAIALIDEQGNLKLDKLPALITSLQQQLYSYGPNHEYDGKRQEHLLRMLQLLHTNKELQNSLKKISITQTNLWIEEIIRRTLNLSEKISITSKHARQASLAALFCYLRQNIGSCFATAPAEIIHDEQPLLFLQDMYDLIAFGKLKRVMGGIEYTVPLNMSSGSGNLKKPIIIRQSDEKITPQIWHSPGLLVAFETIGLIDKNSPLKEKMKQIENLIRELIPKKFSIFVLNAEVIIRKILLQFFKITEKDLKEYSSLSATVKNTTYFMPGAKKGATKTNERCEQFTNAFKKAKNAFNKLTDNALLKSWEFTLASFSEIKSEFTNWNLYASLGLQNNEPEGIGQRIHQIIQTTIDELNSRLQATEPRYEMVYTQIKTLETRMRSTSTEKELQWLKLDYQGRLHDLHFLEEERQALQARAQGLVNLYEALYPLYIELFKDYFQELYDPDVHEVQTAPFDDSPAGFRLVYKHGRRDSSQWTYITNPHEFIEALTAFFIATEMQIAHSIEQTTLQEQWREIVTAIIHHIKTDLFLESAFARMALAHNVRPIKNPLENLDRIEKKPWVYTSGGTMSTLVSCYFRLSEPPKQVARWVENEMELLVFIADTLKQIAPRLLEGYAQGRRQAMLMESPTHAFLLKPMLHPFQETWTNNAFTYTFIRDRFVLPAQIFVEKILLDYPMMQFIIATLAEPLPENFKNYFKNSFSDLPSVLSPMILRDVLIERLAVDKKLHLPNGYPIISADEIDSLFYTHLPLVPIAKLSEQIIKIVNLLPAPFCDMVLDVKQVLDEINFSSVSQNFVSAVHLQNFCKICLCLTQMYPSTAQDISLLISRTAQDNGLAMPTPLLFADTNWMQDYFGFVVNPGTGKLELWRLNYSGTQGHPMSSWKQWVDGSHPEKKWHIYVNPLEYGQY